jgi:hypothetical protein
MSERPLSAKTDRTARGDKTQERATQERAASKPGAGTQEALSSVSRLAVDQFAAAMRRHCLKQPQDCLNAIDSLRDEAVRRALRR